MFGQSEKNIIVSAHRGYKARYPENTMLSFQKAAELGVDMIEMDLHLSRDNHLVVIHDDTLDRTTNGKGLVADFTLAELSGFDAGISFGEEFAGEKIPSFEEFLDYIGSLSNMYLNVELKTSDPKAADLAFAALSRRAMEDKMVIACFDAAVLRYVHSKYGVKTQGFPSWYMSNFTRDTYRHVYAVGIEMRDLTWQLCEDFKSRSIDPWGYCPDTEEAVFRAIKSGCTLVTCNDPAPALSIFRQKGLHA